MIDSKLVDSCIWIEYLFEENFSEIIGKEEHLQISCLSLFEIKSKLLKRKIPEKEVNEKIMFIKNKCIILALNSKICEKAAEICADKNIPAIDALIYATATAHNLELLTSDNDFRGLNNVTILN